jgi:hypothetical protein
VPPCRVREPWPPMSRRPTTTGCGFEARRSRREVAPASEEPIDLCAAQFEVPRNATSWKATFEHSTKHSVSARGQLAGPRATRALKAYRPTRS